MEKAGKERIWRKGIYGVLLGLILVIFPLQVRANEANQEVTIYGLSSKDGEKISIPSGLPQSYRITAGSGQNPVYRIVSGNAVKVSADGLVTPKYTYWKRYSNYSSSVPEGDPYDYYTLNGGDAAVTITAGGKTYSLTVHVEDYAVTYCEGVMDAYLKENIKEGMADLEILKAIARFPASYDYSASYSSVNSMILHGGGDCWASTGAIVALCQKLGIRAWGRNGNKDPGAGGGHRNAMAELNGKYYELEAGYSMGKVDGYRPYDVTPRDSLFSCSATSAGVVIYQYDGYETSGVLEVPKDINGKKVIGIDTSAFSSLKFSEIRLPAGLEKIGDYAFSGCKELTRLVIPASVSSIGKGAFANCEGLTELSVESGNANYKEAGQVIYSKDGGTLVACPAAGEVTIPSTVARIADYAFYYNGELKCIAIPASVTEMGEGAFGNCGRLSKMTFQGEGLVRIGTHCFRSDDKLSTLKIPASVKAIGAYAFAQCNQLKYIHFLGGAPAFGETIEGKFYDSVFSDCRVKAYYKESSGGWTEEIREGHGGNVTWLPWGGEGASIENGSLKLEKEEYAYTGAEIRPSLTLSLDGVALVEERDYVVAYSHNRDVGTAEVTALGVGSYQGELTAEFRIKKAERKISAYARKASIMEKDFTEIRVAGGVMNCTYTSGSPSIASVDSEGRVKGLAAGTAEIVVTAPETESYLSSETKVKITVTHDVVKNVVDGTPQNGRIKVKCGLCGNIYDATVPTQCRILWSRDGFTFSYSCGSRYQAGDSILCLCEDMSNADMAEIEIISEDTNVVQISEDQWLKFVADGVARVTVRPKYNPAIGKTFTFYVGTASQGGTDQTGNGDSGEGNPEDDPDHNDLEDGSQDSDGQKTQYKDKKTGMTISIKGKKEAALTAVDKKKAVGTLKIPDTLKVDGKSYKVTEIGKNAFKNQKKMKKVVMGKYVKTIGENAFSGCEKLQAVTIGKNVTVIGNKAFYKCKKLRKITIPAKVKKIGKSAFYGCKSLKTMTVQTKKLTGKNVGSKAFKGIYAKAVVKVPKSKLSAYKKLFKAKGVGAKVKIKK